MTQRMTVDQMKNIRDLLLRLVVDARIAKQISNEEYEAILQFMANGEAAHYVLHKDVSGNK